MEHYCVFILLLFSVPLCIGPGCQRQGPAEYGHYVFSPNHLAHGLPEQDGSPGLV